MSKQVTIYYDSDGPDLKSEIRRLSKRRDLPYFKRSESAIAAMLLTERLEEITGDAGGGGSDPE